MQRRPKGTGSLRCIAAKNLWCGYITLPRDLNGGKSKRKVVYARTREEVESKLEFIRSRLDVRNRFGRHTLGEYLTRWLETKKQTRKRRTFDFYRFTLRSVFTHAGHIPLKDFDRHDVRTTYGAIAKEGATPHTLLAIHRTLHAALNHSIRDGLRDDNPADLMTPPRPEFVERAVWSGEQAATFLKYLQERQHPRYPLYLIAITCGLRIGEIAALHWEDVDLERRVLKVRFGITESSAGLQRESPKTKRARRDVALSPIVVDALKAYREKSPHPVIVFPHRRGGYLRSTNFLNQFHRVQDKAGMPRIRFHDLRHVAASLAVQANLPPTITQQRLGHADVRTTLQIYSHAHAKQAEEGAWKIEAVLFGREEGQGSSAQAIVALEQALAALRREQK